MGRAGRRLNRKRLYGSRGALSMPLGGQFGLQVDVTGGSLERRGFGSIGGHLFWRNPSQGLVGLYVNHVHWNEFGGVHATHVAAEGEIYAGPWTLQAIVGAEFGNSASNIITATSVTPPAIGFPGAVSTATLLQTYDVKTRFMDQVNLKYYLTENWNGYVGHRYLGGHNALALGSEMALPLGGGVMGSAFVEARLGSRDFEGVWGGLKVYLGRKDKSLIRRHREDDPIHWDTLFSILGNFHQNISGSTQGIDPLPPVCIPTPSNEFCEFGPPS